MVRLSSLTESECIEALKKENRSIWVYSSNPSSGGLSLEDQSLKVPEKLAVVVGTEDDTIREFFDVAEKQVFMPVFGFTSSLTISISSALLLYGKNQTNLTLQTKTVLFVSRGER